MAEELQSRGWYLSEDGWKCCQNAAKQNCTDVATAALNMDIKDIGCESHLSQAVREKANKVVGPLVLQIQKIRNVSAPAAREESNAATRMFRLTLSDGVTSVLAVELEPLAGMGFNTAPGSKILLRGSVPMKQGFLLVNNSNCKYLGGEVSRMKERWQMNKELAMIGKNRNTSRANGPPPFVPFGQSIKAEQMKQITENFNALKASEPNVSEKDGDTEFEAKRKMVIAKALEKSEGTKKTYGGIKQSDAEEPLKRSVFRRPIKEKKPAIEDKDPNVSDDEDNHKRGKGRGRRRRHNSDDGVSDYNAKSTASSTLFDFLSDKFVDDKKTSEHSNKTFERDSVNSHENSKNFGGRSDEGGWRGERRGGHQQQHTRHDQQRVKGRGDDSNHTIKGDYRNSNDENSTYGRKRNQGEYPINRANENSHTENSRLHERSQGHQYDRNLHQRYEGSQRQQTAGKNSSHGTKGMINSARGPNCFQSDRQYGDNYRSKQNQPSGRDASTHHHQQTTDLQQQHFSKQHHRQQQKEPHSQQLHSQQQPRSQQPRSQQQPYSQQQPHSQPHQQQSFQHQTSQQQTGTQNQKKGQQNNPADVTKDERNYSGNQRSVKNMPMKASPAGQSAEVRGQTNSKGFQKYSTTSGKQLPSGTAGKWVPKPGDIVMARFWQDRRFYKFMVKHATSAQKYVGVFVEYGNIEEVHVDDIQPISTPLTSSFNPNAQAFEGSLTKGMEFTRRP